MSRHLYRRRTAPLLCAAILGGAALAAAHPGLADEARPLLMEGKRTLYQRVITRPAAQVHRSSPENAGQPVQPFTIYYVYARKTIGGKDWIEVGPSTAPPVAGWIESAQTIRWKQSLTVAFNNPSGRHKVLFFRDRAALEGVLNAPSPAAEAARLRTAVQGGAAPAGSPLIALEPDNYIDIEKHFYLLPILSSGEAEDSQGNQMRMLEVASLPLSGQAMAPVAAIDQPKTFNAGLVFVIDTTLSMDPYIERTREAVKRIYDKVRNTELGKRFHFGLVAFRSSTKAVPQLEYVTKDFHKLNPDEDPSAFLPAVAGVVASRVSSARVDEDAFAGVERALGDNDWGKFAGRYIVLITDSGALDANDPLSSTGDGAYDISRNAQAKYKPFGIFVLHLLTPEEKKDHAYATRQYRELARWENGDTNYFSIPGGTVQAFGEAVDRLTDTLVHRAADDKLQAEKNAMLASQQRGKKSSLDERIERQAAIVSNAMRLAYLGRKEGTSAPDVIDAWTVDHDLQEPQIASLDVRVLLSKNQLSDLSDALKLILEQGRTTELSPQDFFTQLRIAAAATSRDPRQLGHLGRLRDLIGEYLDGLPYRSQVLEITEDQWQSMGGAEQNEILNTIDEKLRLYKKFNDEPHLWVSFDNGRIPGDAVYPVPLEALP